MSGHSKWSTIKRQKGVTDMKRGQLFTKLSMAITMAVKQGGNIGDPDSNFKLRLAVEAARAANMPKENIERAIARATGGQSGDLQELFYEGFGPGGFSVIVEALTDNNQRTVAEVKNVFTKNGGSMGAQGSVAYQFTQRGVVYIDKNGNTLDDVFLVAADSGAEDVEEEGNEILVYTRPEDLSKVRSSLQAAGYTIKNAEIVRQPNIFTEIADPEIAKKAVAFVEKMEELADVQKVYANLDIPETLATEL
jgi:YebC/PmpR family DNA-binding regulatory protein